MLVRCFVGGLFAFGGCDSEDPGGRDAATAAFDAGRDAELARADAGRDADIARLDAAHDASTSSPDASGAPDADLGDALRIFITSTVHTGALALDPGGLDAPCMAASAAAGLDGRWVLWLAIDGASAQDRVEGDGPFVDMAGTVIFPDRAGLASEPLTGLELDENGADVPFVGVWTGTNGDGTQHESHCAQWTDDTAETRGRVGAVSETTIEWTSRGTFSCDNELRLYCFEQRD